MILVLGGLTVSLVEGPGVGATFWLALPSLALGALLGRYAFDKKKIIGIDELSDPDKTLHIDSKVLDTVESEEMQAEPTAAPETDSETEEGEETPTERKKSKKELALELHEKVDTVGKHGKAGAQVRNVISVGMLTEGWDAKTVTHIMGLRAFTSQLLCEQVVGRGLRRSSYDVDPESGLFEPEYVNIFGIPFTFMPHEDTGTDIPKPTKPKYTVEPLAERRDLEITFQSLAHRDRVQPGSERGTRLDAVDRSEGGQERSWTTSSAQGTVTQQAIGEAVQPRSVLADQLDIGGLGAFPAAPHELMLVARPVGHLPSWCSFGSTRSALATRASL